MLTLSLLFALAQTTTTALPVEPPSLVSISGTVTDKDFAPLAGARVRWSPGDTEVRSRADGTFMLSVPESEHPRFGWATKLTVEFPGLAKTVVDGLPDVTRSVDLGPLQLLPFVELRGRVVAGDGTGIEGALIHSEHVEGLVAAKTDREGKFSCRNLPSGTNTLGVSAPGFADRLLEPHELTWREPNELNITLAQTSRSVSISVRSERTGAPLVARGIYCPGHSFGRSAPWPMGGRRDGYGERTYRRAFWRLGELESDATGVLTIDHVPNEADPGGVYVEAHGHVRTYVPLGRAETSVRLQELGWIDVRVKRVPPTEPAQIRSVEVRCGQENTGWSDGWRSTNFWPAHENVQCVSPDHSRIAWPPEAESGASRSPGSVRIELKDGGVTKCSVAPGGTDRHWTADAIVGATHEIRGRVVTADGKPVRLNLRVLLEDQEESHAFGRELGRGFWIVRADTDNDGAFALRSIGALRGEFVIDTPGWEFASGSAPFYAPTSPPDGYVLTVVPSKPESARGVATARFVVRGVVRVGGAPPGRPLELGFGPPDSNWTDAVNELESTRTDAEGRFELVLPRSGHWWLRPRDPRQLGTSLRNFSTDFINLKAANPWAIEVTGPLLEGVQVDLPPFEEWTAEPLKHR